MLLHSRVECASWNTRSNVVRERSVGQRHTFKNKTQQNKASSRVSTTTEWWYLTGLLKIKFALKVKAFDVYAVSDLHTDHEENLNWVKSLSVQEFSKDVLIVAGDISDSLERLQYSKSKTSVLI